MINNFSIVITSIVFIDEFIFNFFFNILNLKNELNKQKQNINLDKMVD